MLYLITGPPAAGKTTWVQRHAQPGDITIDYDTLAEALGGDGHDHSVQIKAVTKAARQAAIDAALPLAADHDVYVIHGMPSADLLARYQALGARIVTVDPGREVVMARCKEQRAWQMTRAAETWYAQQTSGGGQQTRSAPPALAFFEPPP